MSKSVREWDVDQVWLLPASVYQFVPPGHLARFVRDTVREALDFSAITRVHFTDGDSRIMPSLGGFIDGYLSPGRIRHGETDPTAGRVRKSKPRLQAMAETIRRAGRRSRYRLRKQVVEPVFGQIKQARGFRQFLLRGLNEVRGEWAMLCTVPNLLKRYNAPA